MTEPLEMLRTINATAEFNRWCGFKVVSADKGSVELALRWRKEFGNMRVSSTPVSSER